MKATTLSILLAVIGFMQDINAQPLAWAFPDSGIVWCQGGSWGPPNQFPNSDISHQIFPDGSDTIINGLRYFKLFHTGSGHHPPQNQFYTFTKELYGFFRNDTLNEQVIFTKADSYSIVYDFNLNVGDTIRSFPGYPAIVDSIATIWIGGIQRRVYFYDNWAGGYTIEGIGPNTGLGEEASLSGIDYAGTHYLASLSCLTINDSSYSFSYVPPMYSDTACNLCNQILGTVKNIHLNNSIALYPNPANDKLILRFENAPSNSSLTIQNIYSQEMHYENINTYSKEQAINISSLPAGTYLAIIKTDKGLSVSQFLVIR